MKAYAFDYNGKFIQELEADLDPEVEKARALAIKKGEKPIEKRYIIPGNATLEKPKTPKGKEAFFINNAWVYIDPPVIPEPEKPIERKPTYQEKRLMEYPVINDFVDAMVKIESKDIALIKEGREQLDKYVADCLAVKAKYPKE